VLRAVERTYTNKRLNSGSFTLNSFRGNLFEDEIIEQVFIGSVSLARHLAG
jgi:hypothetical protein